MKYYVRVTLENGQISQDVDVFSTLEEAKRFKHIAENAGNQATIFEIELIPMELEKLHEYIIVSKLLVEKCQVDNESMAKALTEILEISESHDEDTVMSIIADISHDVLAAIGGIDEL